MELEDRYNDEPNKRVVIRSTSKEVFSFALQYRLDHGYSFIKTERVTDQDGTWYCALLVRKNDMIFRIFGI